MKEKRWKSVVFLFFILVGILLHIKPAYAYTTTSYSQATIFKEGYLYFGIEGGSQGNSKVRLKVYNSIIPSWDHFNNSSTSWKVMIVGGANKHNIQVKSTTVQTKKDTTPEWNIINIELTYDMPAHYTYISEYIHKAPPRSRINFKYYNQENSGENSARKTGYHDGSVTKRTINLQVNATQIGLRTYYNKRYQDVEITMKVALPQRKVNVGHYYQSAKDQKWHQFYNQNFVVTDTQSIIPYSTNAPSGYHVSPTYKIFQNGTLQTTGSVNSQGAYICGGDKSIHIDYYANNYQNVIHHWAGGFMYGEGNNSGKNMFWLGDTNYNSLYDVSWSLDTSKAFIPRGFELSKNMATSHIDGYWKSYSLPIIINQKAMNMSFEYYYYPQTYSITYDLQGGKNHPNNPSSYNILYGISLQPPTKDGYEFVGWYQGNQKVLGINIDKNAKFSNMQDFYNEMNIRQIGNVVLRAHWKKINPPVLQVPVNTFTDKTPWYDEQCQYFVLNQGEVFEAKRYASAYDERDGDITSQIIVEKNTVPLNNLVANKSGVYEVVYSVTNSYHLKTQASMKVLINEAPMIFAKERYIVKDKELSWHEILMQVGVVDKEEGIFYKGKDVSENLDELVNQQVNIHQPSMKIEVRDASNMHLVTSLSNLHALDQVAFTPKQEHDYIVCIDVYDSHFGHTSQQFDMHIVSIDNIDRTFNKIARYIHLDSLYSLQDNGIWKNNQMYYHTLTASLNRTLPVYTYHFSKETIQTLKHEQCIPSVVSNISFIRRYMR